MKKHSKKAFTLIELSIVVVIISIISVGVLQGLGMIKSARINNARSITSSSPVLETDGLVAWYETSFTTSFASGEMFDNSQITQWRDISPNSQNGNIQKNVLTTSASSAVILSEDGIGNIPAIKFSGSGSLSLSNFFQGNSVEKTIFVVLKPLATSSQTILDSHSSGSTSSISMGSNTVTLNAGNSVSTLTSTNSANFQVNNDYIITAYFNQDASKVYINDAENITGGAVLASSIGTNELKGLTIGSNKSTTNNFNGFISEIIIFDRVIKEVERQEIIKYLGKKYKINVSGV